MTKVAQGFYRISIDEQGRMLLPPSLLEMLGISSQETLLAVPLPKALLLVTPSAPEVPQLTAEIARLADEQKVTLVEMLEHLDRIKGDLYREKYGVNNSSQGASSIS